MSELIHLNGQIRLQHARGSINQEHHTHIECPERDAVTRMLDYTFHEGSRARPRLHEDDIVSA
jgi:hypothetical protein